VNTLASSKGSKTSFLKKRSRKIMLSLAALNNKKEEEEEAWRCAHYSQKFFGSFFQKRTASFFLPFPQ
jgi:hypothetical protein